MILFKTQWNYLYIHSTWLGVPRHVFNYWTLKWNNLRCVSCIVLLKRHCLASHELSPNKMTPFLSIAAEALLTVIWNYLEDCVCCLISVESHKSFLAATHSSWDHFLVLLTTWSWFMQHCFQLLRTWVEMSVSIVQLKHYSDRPPQRLLVAEENRWT